MSYTGMEIAVVGMACRFPKSKNIREFWQHLRAGDELVTQFSEEDLKNFGVDPKMKIDPGYVAAEAIINDSGHFDAEFFKITESDAKTMDPQQRLLLECAWHALEDGGYSPHDKALNCGVFVSSGNNKYYLQNVLSNPEKVEEVGEFQIEIGNSVNFLATRISYLFNLTGPASVVQTACSSSLVAIHYACQSLLNGECDLALSGGSKIEVPQNYGHVHTEGGVKSSEGHCRVFDKDASGFVNGNGCGMVLLKRLEDALADGDEIYGIVKGSALNNDGSEKIGYTAPSIPGQQQVIQEALDIAEVTPESISYIEAHGTGTKLGDPVEIDGLKQVFTANHSHCALGSVKANMGHLDAAAGVAGFIKAILTLHHKEICPQVNFNELNPAIELDGSPFYISTELQTWSEKDHPFRAGVSSFGIGGTNAHVVLEEASAKPITPSGQTTGYSLIVNSAKTEQSVLRYQSEVSEWLNPDTSLSQFATSSWKRQPQFRYRSSVVADDTEALNKHFQDPDTPTKAFVQPKVYFLFPGQGSQYTNMTRELYEQQTTYRAHLDTCLNTLKELSGINFKNILFAEEDQERIHETQYAQPLIFSVEYALVQLLAEYGVKPDAMIGHSLGEITAACISGTITLKESLQLVLTRSRLMQSMPRGSMVSVSLNGERRFLEELPESLCIAAINSEANYVISGDTPSVTTLEEQLNSLNVKYRRLRTSHAYHSYMMKGMLDEFEAEIADLTYRQPTIPFVSNLTGDWMKASDISADYWKRHVVNPVRFLNGIRLLDDDEAVFIEVGPGSALSYLTGQTYAKKPTISLIPPNAKETDPMKVLHEGFGKIWEHGISIDLGLLMQPGTSRLRLPGYVFDHKNYWLPQGKYTPGAEVQTSEDLTYVPYWKSLNFEIAQHSTRENYLLLADSPSKVLIRELEQIAEHLVIVQPGKRFTGKNKSYQVNFSDQDQIEQLFATLKAKNLFPRHIIYALSITTEAPDKSIAHIDTLLNEWYYPLLNVTRSLSPHLKQGISLDVLTNDTFSVLGNESITALKTTLAGPAKIAPLEYEGLESRLIEYHSEDWNRDNKTVARRLSEYIRSEHQPEMKVVSLRGNTFWGQAYQSIKAASKETPFRKKGIYLITGGFGGMGSTISKFLAEKYHARVALFTSSQVPEEDQWSSQLEEKDRRKVELLHHIKAASGEARAYAVDISNHQEMQVAISDILNSWGKIHGVIHTAGKADFGGILANRTNESIQEVLKPKIHGHLVLKAVTAKLPLDFFINFSSIGNQLYGKKFGQIAYNTANEYLDACASAHEKTINWCDWLDVGMAFDAIKKKNKFTEAKAVNAKVMHGIKPAEGVSIFQQVLSSSNPHTLISPVDLQGFIAESNTRETMDPALEPGHEGYKRDELIEKLTALYLSFFGITELDIQLDFNDLGGDSLKAVVMLSRIKKKLKLPLTLSEFYEHSSVASLSAFLSEEVIEEVIELQVESFLLQSAQNQIFGTWHTSSTPEQIPIIICPPVFQEEIIANQALDHLSERLASQHAPVVRFDFTAMGNSEGNELKLDLEDWYQNLNDIILEAKNKFSCERVNLIGLRMGATVINAFFDRLAGSADHVLFWHPVQDGVSYFKELSKYQRLFVEGSFGDKSSLNSNNGALEFSSYQITKSMRASIEGLKFDLTKHPDELTLIASAAQNRTTNTTQSVNLIYSDSPPFWNKLASEKEYLPEEDIDQIIHWHQNTIT